MCLLYFLLIKLYIDKLALRQNTCVWWNWIFNQDYRKKINQLELAEEEKQRLAVENARLREEMQDRWVLSEYISIYWHIYIDSFLMISGSCFGFINWYHNFIYTNEVLNFDIYQTKADIYKLPYILTDLMKSMFDHTHCLAS